MNCCGQKRQQWQQEITPREIISAPIQPVLENPVAIAYNGTTSCIIKGAATGYIYLFAPQETGLMVDGRDVEEMVRGRDFLKEGKMLI
jgi:hypothetical protein